MPKAKGQSDGIRKRGGARVEHTISLVGKGESEDALKQVPLRSEKKELETKPIRPEAVVKPQSGPVLPEILPEKKPSAGSRPLVPDIPLFQKKAIPEERVLKDAATDILPPSLAQAPQSSAIGDKVSSWFSKKKQEESGKEDNFYTGVGFTEEEHGGKKRRSALVKGIAAGGGGVIILFVLLSTVFARVTVILHPKVETVEVKDVAMVFDTSATEILAKQKIIPAAKLELTKSASKEFDSTGKKIADFKARGNVKIYNAFNTSSQALIATTRFVTDKGQLYRLPASVTVPPAKTEGGKIVPQFVEAELVADQTGESGNVSGEVRLEIPGFQGSAKYGKFYAVAAQGFSGGARGGERRIVTADDRTRASEEVTKQVYAELEKESAAKVPPDFTVVDTLRSIEVTKVDAPLPDTPADRFSVRADAMARLIVFREEDVVSFLRGLIVGVDQKKEIVPDSVSLTYTVRSADYAKGRAEVVLRGSIETRAIIPEGDMVQVLAGRSIREAEESLSSREDILSSVISRFPPWLLNVPKNAEKIRVQYK